MNTHVVLEVGLAGGLTGAVLGGALVARVVLRVAAAVVELDNAGALGFVSGGGPFPSLFAAFPLGRVLTGRNGWGASPSAMAASLRGWWSMPMFSCALRLRELVVLDDADAMVGTERVVTVGGRGCPGRSGEEERNRGSVPFSIYARYLKHAGGVIWAPVIILLLTLMQGASGMKTCCTSPRPTLSNNI